MASAITEACSDKDSKFTTPPEFNARSADTFRYAEATIAVPKRRKVDVSLSNPRTALVACLCTIRAESIVGGGVSYDNP